MSKDTRITRCDFFAVALEVAPGSQEFLFESAKAESATANSSFLRIP